MPEHIWSEIDAKERKTFENYPNPIGTGAFHVVEWQKGQFFRMEANEDYWGGEPQIDEFVYRIFNNEDALVQALKAGEIDFADTLGANLFDSLENSPGIATNEASIPSFEEIGFNVGADETIKDSDGHPALKDVEVRQAMAMAIDKEVLVDRIVRGHATVGSTIVPPSIPFYHYEPAEDEVFPFDPEAANQTLDDAGYETPTATASGRCPAKATAAVPLLRPQRRELDEERQRVHQRVAEGYRDRNRGAGADGQQADRRHLQR